MAFTIPYERATYRPKHPIVPHNDDAADPVEFDIVPAEGADRARIRSIIVATSGITGGIVAWGPEAQHMVVEAFRTARGIFDETVTAVRGLAVPYPMALRVGLVEPPKPGAPAVDQAATVPVRTGREFTRVQGFLPMLAFMVAMEIDKISRTSDLDSRFFAPPSGSPQPEATSEAAIGTASAAATPSGDDAIAASSTPTGSRPRSTSRSRPSLVE